MRPESTLSNSKSMPMSTGLDDDVPLAQRLLALQKRRAAEIAAARCNSTGDTFKDGQRALKFNGTIAAPPTCPNGEEPAKKKAKKSVATTASTTSRILSEASVKIKPDPGAAVKIKADPGAGAGGYKNPFLKEGELPRRAIVRSEPSKRGVAGKKDPAHAPLATKEDVSINGSNKYDDEEEADEEHRWWEAQNNDGSIKWTTLEHNGLLFPPLYEAHGVPLLYDGKVIHLEPAAEEVASFFAAILGTDHHENEIFRKNFFDDFCEVLHSIDSTHRHVVKQLEKCDFSLINAHLTALREAKKTLSKEEKQRLKEEKARIDEFYGTCLLDGRKEKVGNFRVEPPGLFRGRGKHPKAGKLKQRILPEQVTINIGHGARIPDPPAGHSWGGVVHDNTVTWLATWVENINKGTKYVFLAAGSSLKGQSDLKKFETARKLAKHVKTIRRVNAEELQSKEMFVRQRATALWLIDRLALRAGNEKGDDEADTVGCCSLRCEHVRLVEPNTVVFDFLGKDSIRYYNEVPVDKIVFKNLGIFMRPPKTKDDLIFDRLNTGLLNKYLTGLMPGLTAKVFRTYNASHTFQEELDKTPDILGDTPANIQELVLAYNRANRQVAILCNHQRSVPKTHEQSMGRLNEKILTMKYQRYLVRRQLRELIPRKELKMECPAALDEESDMDGDTVSRKAKEAEELILAKSKAKPDDGEASSSSPRKSSTKQPSKESLIKRFSTLTMRIEAAKSQRVDKDENKTTALGTSKTNYIDPRITAAWCQKYSVSVEKMFNKSLREKFKWAMTVKPEWRF